MKKRAILIFYCFFFAISIADARESARQTIKYKRRTFSLDLPKNWIVNKKLFGVPVMIVGPMENGSRATIAITTTGRDDYTLNEGQIIKDHASYKEGRRKWVQEYKGYVKNFFPYEKVSWDHLKNVHATGFRYVLSGTHQEERTYYFLCNKELIHLKTLFNEDNVKNGREKLEKVIKSLRCK